MPPSVERARELYEASARQDFRHAVEALERLKNGPAPELSKKKQPEKKPPEKGSFFKGLFGKKK